jgi:hypothetical protein
VRYLEFTPQGRWHGLSYYFGLGNGCGFCTSEVASTVKLTDGKLVGTLKGTEKDRPFTVTLNIPVTSDDHGPALPADGVSEDHPLKSVKVTKAWGGRDQASLLIEGESELGKVSCEVFLVNTGGAWGVDEELVELALGR